MLCLLVTTTTALAKAQSLQLAPRIEVAPPSVRLEPQVQAWLQQHSHINVGIWGISQPPVSIGLERGLLVGIDADYLAMLESALSIHFQLLYFPTRDEALTALSSGEITMLAVWRPALEDSLLVEASIPWLRDHAVVMHTPESNHQREIDHGMLDLMSGHPSNWDPAGPNPRSFQNYYHTVQNVAAGKNSAVVINHATASYLIRDRQVSNLWLTPDHTLGALNFSFGVSQHSPLLLAINATLNQLPLVSRLRISNGWGLGHESVYSPEALDLNYGEIEWLARAESIGVILDSRQAPLSYVNEQGKFDGLAVELLKFLNGRYGLQFQYHIVNNDDELGLALKKHPQAILSHLASVAGERDASSPGMTSTIPWLVSPAVLLMHRQHERPTSLHDLSGERIAIEQNSPLRAWLETWFPTIQLVPVVSAENAVRLLELQQVRAAITSQFSAQFYLRRSSADSLYQALALPVHPLNIGFGTSRADSTQQAILNKALRQVTPQTLLHIASYWRDTLPVKSLDLATQRDTGWLIAAVLGALLATGLLAFRITQLRGNLKSVAVRLHTKQELIAQLQHAKKENEQMLHSRNQFLKSMGHEVRTPLNAIVGLLEIELAQHQAHRQHNENVQSAYESACVLLSLAGDVFDIFSAEGRDSQHNVRQVNLPSLLQSIVALYRQQADQKGLRITVSNGLPAPMFEVDALFIIRILSSLLRNALQHTQHGEINLVVYQQSVRHDGHLHLVMEVSDQGDGFDAATLLSSVATNDDQHAWAETGFSLAACQHMAKSVGAELTVESIQGKGSAVSLHLHAQPVNIRQPAITGSQRFNVLIVDDYPPARLMLRQQLQSQRHKVMVASNGKEGL